MWEMEKLVREMLWLQNWKIEELPIILEILEERMLLLDWERKPEMLGLLKTYYNCYGDQITLNWIGIERFRTIWNELKEKMVIPSDEEMFKLIIKKKKEKLEKIIEATSKYEVKIKKVLK